MCVLELKRAKCALKRLAIFSLLLVLAQAGLDFTTDQYGMTHASKEATMHYIRLRGQLQHPDAATVAARLPARPAACAPDKRSRGNRACGCAADRSELVHALQDAHVPADVSRA